MRFWPKIFVVVGTHVRGCGVDLRGLSLIFRGGWSTCSFIYMVGGPDFRELVWIFVFALIFVDFRGGPDFGVDMGGFSLISVVVEIIVDFRGVLIFVVMVRMWSGFSKICRLVVWIFVDVRGFSGPWKFTIVQT